MKSGRVGPPLPERLRLELRRVRPHRRHAVDEDVVAVARARLQLGEVERGDVVVLGRRSEDGCDAGGGGPGAPRLGRRVAELHVRRPRRLHPYGDLAVRDVAEHRPGLQRLRPLRDGDGRRRGDVARGVRPRAGRLQHRTAGEEDEQERGGGGACGCGAWRGRCDVASTTHAPPSRRDVAGRGAERDGKAGSLLAGDADVPREHLLDVGVVLLVLAVEQERVVAEVGALAGADAGPLRALVVRELVGVGARDAVGGVVVAVGLPAS